jgi:GTP-binding protein
LTSGKVERVEFLKSVHQHDGFPQDGRPEVAFVGRSNVGKSSLLNRLLGRKGLARVSQTPGRTRSVNYFLVNDRQYFVDLPGYGYAKAGRADRAEWAALVDSYFRQQQPWVVLLVDGKVGATPLDQEARRYLGELKAGVTVVATKIDQVPKTRRAAALAGIRQSLNLEEGHRLIAVSARSGEGMKDLWNEILQRLQAIAS